MDVDDSSVDLYDIVVSITFTLCLSCVRFLTSDHPRRRTVDLWLMCSFLAFAFGSYLSVPYPNLRVRMVAAAVTVMVFRRLRVSGMLD